MKKHLLSMFALATMLLATGCSQVEEPIVSSQSNETVKASFTLDLGAGLGSRTAGDGLTATDLYCGVFDQNGYVIPGLHQQKTLTDRTTTVEFTLVKGQTYDFVFWAQAPNNKHYNVDKNDLTQITVNYNQPANAESRDAFLGQLLDYKVEGHFTKTVYLYRPFAQLNVGTTQEDYKKASALLSVNGTSKEVNKSNLIISKAYTTLNTLTKEVSGEQNNVQLTLEGRPNEYLYVDIDKDGKDEETAYEYLSLNYLLAKESSELFDVKVQLNSDDDVINTLEVPSVPLQRNYRTNIIGNLLTTTGDFTVIVDNKFLTPNHIVKPWNGEVKKPNQNDEDVYEIYEPAELAWVAQEVNGGEDFAGETIQIMADLDLNNYQWTPIGNNEKAFRGTLDGGNFIIKHLLVNTTDAPAGLVGWLNGTVQNLKIEDANVKGGSSVGVAVGKIFNTGLIQNVHVSNSTVEGNHYVGGIAGYAYGSIKDCSSTDVVVVAKPEAVSRAITYQNGDKAGGILGFLPNDCNGEVSGNTATNVDITAYRDLGGIIGAGKVTNVKNNKVIGTLNLTIDNTVTCYDQNGKAEAVGNANNIVGRTLSGTLDSSNITEATVTNNTITETAPEGLVKIDDTTWEITNMEGLFEFAKSVNEDGVTYSGATVKLTADIALAKAPWTPIGLNADGKYKFQGIFNGQGHTISDLYVETEAGYTAAGFFGALNGTAKNFTIDGAIIKHISTGNATDNGIAVVAGSIYNKGSIEGVTVKNAVVEGNRYVGGISGYTYGSVKNCVVENITLNATPDLQASGNYDNGDKVGGIAGYFVDENTYEISGNKVLNAKITGYRDMGGIVGAGDGTKDKVLNVTNNSVNVATITVDQETYFYEEKDGNAAAIVGRLMNGTVAESNTYASVTINNGDGTSTDGEGNYFVAGSEEADFNAVNNVLNNLGEGETLYLDGNVESNDAPASNAYGKTGINMVNGGTVDGNGNTLSVPAANTTWDSALNTTGGTIKNLTIDAGFRGIFINHNSENCSKVYLENVTIDGPVYTISCDQGTNNGLEATDCTFNGWTSYAATIGNVKFTNCNFGEGAGYSFCRPYAPTEFVGCNFEAGYEMDPRAAVTFENCKLNGVALTAENLATLVTSNIANATVK